MFWLCLLKEPLEPFLPESRLLRVNSVRMRRTSLTEWSTWFKCSENVGVSQSVHWVDAWSLRCIEGGTFYILSGIWDFWSGKIWSPVSLWRILGAPLHVSKSWRCHRWTSTKWTAWVKSCQTILFLQPTKLEKSRTPYLATPKILYTW